MEHETRGAGLGREYVWLGLCVMSLVCYLLRSEAVSAFVRDVLRELGER